MYINVASHPHIFKFFQMWFRSGIECFVHDFGLLNHWTQSISYDFVDFVHYCRQSCVPFKFSDHTEFMLPEDMSNLIALHSESR